MKILILFAHPRYEMSKVHRELLKEADKLPFVTVHDLYQDYHDFYIDIAREQALLREHEMVIWQHPFYWYSAPPLLKQWIDMVLEFGWAYGPGGTHLSGKKIMSVISTGGNEEAYTPAGHHGHSIDDFLLPFHHTARLCQMNWLPPFVVHGSYRITTEILHRKALEYASMLRSRHQQNPSIDTIPSD
jgi:glutathione-regulated potassium-efflux system ancillary protein KefG